MDIKRDKYLNDLINRMHNGMIKVVTGIRRCGKSYLLFNIFKNLFAGAWCDCFRILLRLNWINVKTKSIVNPDTILDYIES